MTETADMMLRERIARIIDGPAWSGRDKKTDHRRRTWTLKKADAVLKAILDPAGADALVDDLMDQAQFVSAERDGQISSGHYYQPIAVADTLECRAATTLAAARQQIAGLEAKLAGRVPEYRCTSTMSEDGGSCSPRITCTGNTIDDSGCGEPCTFRMHPDTGEII